MREDMWKADPDLVASSLDILIGERDAMLASSGDAERTLALLDAAGTLRGSGEDATIRRELADPAIRGEVERFLPSWGLGSLLEAAATIRTEASRLATLAREDRAEVVVALQEALRARDRAEVVLMGAEVLLGTAGAFDSGQQAILAGFDELVRPELWRLVPMNDSRAAELQWMMPEFRVRFWWRSLGAGLPTSALDSMVDAAGVVALFPSARIYFDALARTYRPRAPRDAKVVPIDTGRRAARAGQQRLAAARGDWRTGVVGALFVDKSRRRGHAGRVEVTRREANAERFSKNLLPVLADVEAALEMAVKYARQWLDPFTPMPDAGEFRVTLENVDGDVEEGRSLQLPVALAALGAHFGWEAVGVFATGELGTNRRLERVNDLSEKVEAALRDADVQRIVVPSSQMQQISGKGAELATGVTELDDAATAIFPIRRVLVRAGTHKSQHPGVPAGWSGAEIHDATVPISADNLADEACKAVSKLVRGVPRNLELVQLMVAGPVGLGAAVYMALSQKSVSLRVLYVQPPGRDDPGGVWCDNQRFVDQLLRRL
jgi:hypothetical protein